MHLPMCVRRVATVDRPPPAGHPCVPHHTRRRAGEYRRRQGESGTRATRASRPTSPTCRSPCPRPSASAGARAPASPAASTSFGCSSLVAVERGDDVGDRGRARLRAAPSTWRSRSRRCAVYSWIRGRGSSITSPWPGHDRDSRSFSRRASVARYCAMSPPRSGFTTENMPSSTVSPVKSTRSSSSRKHRWFGAWPGVCSTSRPNSVPSMVSPSPMTRSGTTVRVLVEALAVGEHLGARGLHQAGGARRVVGMGVGEQHPAHPLLHRRADDGVDVALVVGTGVDDRDLVDADEVGVGAGPGEGTRVGGDDPAHERRQRTRHTGGQVRHSAAPRLPSGLPRPSPSYCRWAYGPPARRLPVRRPGRVADALAGLPQPLLVDCRPEAARRRARRRRATAVRSTSTPSWRDASRARRHAADAHSCARS